MNTKQQPPLKEELARLSNLMSFQMQPFATPIAASLSDGTAKHVGTGGYIEWRRKRLLLTCEHVAREVSNHSLARKCYDSPDYLHIDNPFHLEPAPLDLAISSVDSRWSENAHSAMAFPDYRFEPKHAPQRREYLFLVGYTGEKAHYSPSLETLFTKGTPYLTQEYDETIESEETKRQITHRDFDPAYHFAMHWSPEATTSADGRPSSIPLDPHGLSGSFVWNTRYLEFKSCNKTWTPGVARLTGILWGWDTSDRFLFATRIEHVTAFLVRRCP